VLTAVAVWAERVARHVRRRLVKRLRHQKKRGRRGFRRVAASAPAVMRAGWQRRWRVSYARSAGHVPVRDEIPHLLNRRGLLGRGAEIGVMKGNYSATLLRGWRGRELLSVDPWRDVPGNAEHAREVLAAFGERSRILRMTSVEAARLVPDGALDFAYVDARHDHASVRADLEAWFPKVRAGGILAGHDYPEPGVRRAVDEFFAARGLPVHATGREPAKAGRRKNPSWIVEVRRPS